MKALKIILITLASILISGGVMFYLIGKNAPQPAGININTEPAASVFINGSLVGETPYSSSYKAGKILLRLVPEGSSVNLVPYETQVDLTSGVETVIERTFAERESDSSGYVISLEKTKNGVTQLSITSDPTGIQVSVDGVSRGFSPYDISTIAPAEHLVEIKSSGYKTFSKAIKTVSGYKLTVYVKLGEGTNEESPSAVKPESKSRTVTILGNSVGYVDANSEPGGLGNIVLRINPGETYPYVDTDVATDWVEINLDSTGGTNYGWIPGKFASISAETN